MRIPISSGQRLTLAVVLVFIACVALVSTLKLTGVFIAVLLAGAAWLMVNMRPDASDHASLRTSIELSAEDIQDIITAYEDFATADTTEALADRTLHRPALLNEDSPDPDIEAFHFELAGARRFLRRLDMRLYSAHSETSELETLLNVTDERAAELKKRWLTARRAALRMGPNR